MANPDVLSADMNGHHPDAIYHEHQSLELCLLHALNNLFQGQAFAKESLEIICKDLAPDTWLNPHKSIFGLGNYDVNVLIAALQQKECTAVWFDRRLDPSALDPSQVIGFILNLPSQVTVGMVKVPFWKRRHWISIRQIAGAYFNLDSKLSEPKFIGDEKELFCFLRGALCLEDRQLFVICSKEVERDRTWLKPEFR